MLTLLIILLVIVVLFGAAGRDYYSSYRYGGPGISLVGIILVVLLILLLTGNLSSLGIR